MNFITTLLRYIAIDPLRYRHNLFTDPEGLHYVKNSPQSYMKRSISPQSYQNIRDLSTDKSTLTGHTRRSEICRSILANWLFTLLPFDKEKMRIHLEREH